MDREDFGVLRKPILFPPVTAASWDRGSRPRTGLDTHDRRLRGAVRSATARSGRSGRDRTEPHAYAATTLPRTVGYRRHLPNSSPRLSSRSNAGPDAHVPAMPESVSGSRSSRASQQPTTESSPSPSRRVVRAGSASPSNFPPRHLAEPPDLISDGRSYARARTSDHREISGSKLSLMSEPMSALDACLLIMLGVIVSQDGKCVT